MPESVHHPEHYGGAENPYEAIKVIQAWDLGYELGNAVKYIARAGKKPGTDARTDIDKAREYLTFWLERMAQDETPPPEHGLLSETGERGLRASDARGDHPADSRRQTR